MVIKKHWKSTLKWSLNAKVRKWLNCPEWADLQPMYDFGSGNGWSTSFGLFGEANVGGGGGGSGIDDRHKNGLIVLPSAWKTSPLSFVSTSETKTWHTQLNWIFAKLSSRRLSVSVAIRVYKSNRFSVSLPICLACLIALSVISNFNFLAAIMFFRV